MESVNMNVIKYLLFIFNLIFAISGIAIVIAGGIVLSEVSEFNHFADNQLVGPPVVLIVAGAIVFIIAFLGCFGAIREKRAVLIAFAVLLFVIFIVEMSVGIAAAVYKKDFEDPLKMTLRNSMANYTASEAEKVAWDNVQKKFKCCGVESSTDWQGQNIPYSCCHMDETLKDPFTPYCVDNARGKFLYSTGCYNKLRMKVESNSKITLGVGIGIAFVQISGIILALWLAWAIKKEASDTK